MDVLLARFHFLALAAAFLVLGIAWRACRRAPPGARIEQSAVWMTRGIGT